MNKLVPYINVNKFKKHNTNGYLVLGLCLNSGYIINFVWKMYKRMNVTQRKFMTYYKETSSKMVLVCHEHLYGEITKLRHPHPCLKVHY